MGLKGVDQTGTGTADKLLDPVHHQEAEGDICYPPEEACDPYN